MNEATTKTIIAAAWLLCLALFASPVPAGNTAGAAGGSIELEIVEQRITLAAENADLRDLLQRIANESGIRLWISNRLPPRNITARSDGLPLPALLERLLRQQSYALVLDDASERVTALFVLPPGDAPPARVELKPGPYRDQASVLRDALASPEIPDNIKLAMMEQHNSNLAARAATSEMTKLEVLTRLVDAIELYKTAKPETIRLLRQELEKVQAQQQKK